MRKRALERLKVVIAADAIDHDVKLGEPRSHQEERVLVVQHLYRHGDVLLYKVTVKCASSTRVHRYMTIVLCDVLLYKVTVRCASSTPVHSYMTIVLCDVLLYKVTVRCASSTPVHSYITIVLQPIPIPHPPLSPLFHRRRTNISFHICHICAHCAVSAYIVTYAHCAQSVLPASTSSAPSSRTKSTHILTAQ